MRLSTKKGRRKPSFFVGRGTHARVLRLHRLFFQGIAAVVYTENCQAIWNKKGRGAKFRRSNPMGERAELRLCSLQ
jgi:hypothetical protein